MRSAELNRQSVKCSREVDNIESGQRDERNLIYSALRTPHSEFKYATFIKKRTVYRS